MASYFCPHPDHSGGEVRLKPNNDRVFECEVSHRFYFRRDGERDVFVDLISNASYPAVAVPESGEAPPDERQLSFMSDIPRVAGDLDFNDLSLDTKEWKLLSKVDGRSTLEEVRLLSGMRADEAERIVRRLLGQGLLEIRSRR